MITPNFLSDYTDKRYNDISHQRNHSIIISEIIPINL